MFGRRQVVEASKVQTMVGAGTAARTSALATVDDLLKRAAWGSLTDAQRQSLRADFVPFPAGAVGTAAAHTVEGERARLDWEAGLVASAFQPEAAEVIRMSLGVGAPGTHLFVGGPSGVGRRNLVALLAREAMAQRPAPTEYVYVPEPSSLGDAYLLPLPAGTGADFAKAIDGTLRLITGAWDDAGKTDDNGGSSAGQASAANRAQALGQVVTQAFMLVESPGFDAASAYVARLRAAFDTLARSEADLPVSYDDLPTWLAPVASPASSGARGAPVIVGDLTRDKLDTLLLKANGGVLILSADEVVTVGDSWPMLNAVLSKRAFQVKDVWPLLPLTVRVAMVGDDAGYNALTTAPGDFAGLFRYEAWLHSAVPWTPQIEVAYAVLADGFAAYHGLPAFDASGVSRLIEESARRGEGLNRTYVGADLTLLRDLAVEAGYAASARGASAVTGDDLIGVVARRRTQQSTLARRVREAILTGETNTPTAGAAIGQINGLGIYEYHPDETAFAVPTRISATVSPSSDERLLDIEHEAEQADADHVRGEMTVEGYLAHRYGQDQLLRVLARIRFEQEHGTTGGDSASGAILYALLSALAQVPIYYSRAVTGAVGQYGEVQPIGGVNTKIEGFWELCRVRRAQGERVEGGYGVIIPAVNARDLMLRDEVAQSIATEGWFSVWPVQTVDEALTLLTGVPAAEVHARVERRLQRFAVLGGQVAASR